jgi:hypothetical protein
MSEIDFSKTAVKPAEPVKCTAVARAPSRKFGDFIPSFANMRLPRVNLVQGIGELSETFEPGQIVYKGATVLYDPGIKKPEDRTDPLEVVILGMLPFRYVEKRDGGHGEIVDTLEEVADLKGTIDWNEWNLKKAGGVLLFETLAEFILAIKQPKHLPKAVQSFPFKVDDARYALGIWGMKGSAFNNCAKVTIFPDRAMGCTREFGYPSHSYLASSRTKKFGNGKTSWIPSWKEHLPTSEAFLKFAQSTIESAENPTDSGPAE